MSATPSVPASPVPPPPPPHVAKVLRWQRRILGFCFIGFTIEVGLFLMVFPWIDSWDLNWLALRGNGQWHALWASRYLRGAVSGLGALDLWIAFNELARQLRSLFGRN